MRIILGVAALVAVFSAAGASASVDAVVTSSTATVVLTSPDNVYNFSGDQLAGSANDMGSGGSYDATSDVVGPEITFKNGNFTAGPFAAVRSFTSLDITFTNDSLISVLPMFHSTILPAGLGMLIGSGCGAGPVRDCAEHLGSLVGFDQLTHNSFAEDNRVAEATFLFRVLNDGAVIYNLSGRISLLRDVESNSNYFETDLEAAAAALMGFTDVFDDPTRPTMFSAAWLATDIELNLPGVMNPGDSRVLTYETTVTTLTRNPLKGCAGAIAYSAFGDPIGRNSSIPPTTASRFAAFGQEEQGSCEIGGGVRPPVTRSFQFARPTFENGILGLELLPPRTGTIPEPASWAMMLTGFGIAGSALRRRRQLAAA